MAIMSNFMNIVISFQIWHWGVIFFFKFQFNKIIIIINEILAINIGDFFDNLMDFEPS